MQKNSVPHKKQFVPNAFKFLVAVGSITGTLGIWTMLANRDVNQATAQGNDVGTTNQNQMPLPTIVPLNTASVATSEASTTTQSSPTTGLRDVTGPTGSNSPATVSQANPIVIPGAVTSSRSSRR